jgi:hypothetical protein
VNTAIFFNLSTRLTESKSVESWGGAGELAARSGLRLAAEEEGGSMVSAYPITRERVGYAAARVRTEQDPFGAGFAGSSCSASQSRVGWVPLRDWLRWRHG